MFRVKIHAKGSTFKSVHQGIKKFLQQYHFLFFLCKVQTSRRLLESFYLLVNSKNSGHHQGHKNDLKTGRRLDTKWKKNLMVLVWKRWMFSSYDSDSHSSCFEKMNVLFIWFRFSCFLFWKDECSLHMIQILMVLVLKRWMFSSYDSDYHGSCMEKMNVLFIWFRFRWCESGLSFFFIQINWHMNESMPPPPPPLPFYEWQNMKHIQHAFWHVT